MKAAKSAGLPGLAVTGLTADWAPVLLAIGFAMVDEAAGKAEDAARAAAGVWATAKKGKLAAMKKANARFIGNTKNL